MTSSEEIEHFYAETYECLMGRGAIGLFWRYIHSRLDKNSNCSSNTILLEIGAGHGQHFKLTSLKPALYIETDIRQSMGYSVSFKESDFQLQGCIKRFLDAESLSEIPSGTIDSIIVSCVLAHLNDPEKALTEWRRVLKPGGCLSLYIPCEPGLFLRLVRYFTTRRKLKSLGIVQSNLHWLEHKNHYPSMHFLVKRTFSFDSTQIRLFPFRYFLWDMNLFSLIKIVKTSSVTSH
jgi:ubiquinone/menaquinone biosynthesis C-methylase UbiE